MKNERGSIAVLAFVTVMFILIILATLFYSMVGKSKAQVIEMEKLSSTLDGDMGEIYKERKNVQGIYASSNWTTTKVTNSENLFSNCTSLVGGNDTTYNAEKISIDYAKIDDTDASGYFTAKEG